MNVETPQPGANAVFRSKVTQDGGVCRCSPAQLLPLEQAGLRELQLETYVPVEPGAPVRIQVWRDNDDPRDNADAANSIKELCATALPALPCGTIVQDEPGYNSWPMIGAIGCRLVCAYSRGSAHNISEGCRRVCAKISDDAGKTWSEEVLVTDQPEQGEVTIGCGNDSQGALLLWVRSYGRRNHHELFRTVDGLSYTKLSEPSLDPVPMQMTDIFAVPGHGLMCLWFGGSYGHDGQRYWGTLASQDDGVTWTQRIIEQDIPLEEWPTELAAFPPCDGRILVIARTENTQDNSLCAQFQLQSTDYGATWTRMRTNITDVNRSTPSLIQNGPLVSLYYYERGRGILKRRIARIADVWDNPCAWPPPEPIARGSELVLDAGNANAVRLGDRHVIAFYSGTAPNTAILTLTVNAPAAL